MDIERVYWTFYRVPRLSAPELSDGGGPFGFDITTALEVDYLIGKYRCDAVLETGCNLGDTTWYLGRTYPKLKVITCDVKSQYTDFVSKRCAELPNVTVEALDSRAMLAKWAGKFERPLFYLDAHWYDDWPLAGELDLITRGVVMIDDFDIGHPRFGFDSYGGKDCGPALLAPFRDRIGKLYTNNPEGQYEVPCLQVGRRGGKAYFTVGFEADHLATNPRYFAPRAIP
jgi:hypothetical protein